MLNGQNMTSTHHALLAADPAAWQALLAPHPIIADLTIDTVQLAPLTIAGKQYDYLKRITIDFNNNNDPLTLIAKTTSASEARFYIGLAPQLPALTPYCWHSEVLPGEAGFVILNECPLSNWTSDNVLNALNTLAQLHAAYWNHTGLPNWLPRPLDADNPLAPVEAGLVRMEGLAGWPGVLLQEQVELMRLIYDNPEQLLQPLRDQPLTLLHCRPWSHHWPNFSCLLDWRDVALGPAVWDVVAFVERLGLTQIGVTLTTRDWPLAPDAMINHYIIQISAALGPAFDPGSFRAALPPAQILHTMKHWLPQFNHYFGRLKPSRAIWRTFANFPPNMITRLGMTPLLDNKAYFTGLFERFERAAHQLVSNT